MFRTITVYLSNYIAKYKSIDIKWQLHANINGHLSSRTASWEPLQSSTYLHFPPTRPIPSSSWQVKSSMLYPRYVRNSYINFYQCCVLGPVWGTGTSNFLHQHTCWIRACQHRSSWCAGELERLDLLAPATPATCYFPDVARSCHGSGQYQQRLEPCVTKPY